MRLTFLPFLLLLMPILEISVFITVGGWIGLWPTLGMILVTAFLGTLLLRFQGFQLLGEIQEKMGRNELPGRALVHGVMLLVAGILLLTPGFVTDSIGFSLFVPPVRDAIWGFLKDKIKVQTIGPGMDPNFGMNANNDAAHDPKTGKPAGPVIDLDETEFGPKDANSPWNKSS